MGSNYIYQQERSRAWNLILEAKTNSELIKIFAHPDSFIRTEAVEALAIEDCQETIMAVSFLLNDTCQFTREAAAGFLSKVNTAESLEALRYAFHYTQFERVHYLSNTLAFSGETGRSILINALESKNPNVRYFAARGLGSTKDEKYRDKLNYLQSEDLEKTSFGASVSSGARKALRTMGNPS